MKLVWHIRQREESKITRVLAKATVWMMDPQTETRTGCEEFIWEVILKCRVRKWENKTRKSRETMKDVLTGGLLLEAPRA